MIVFGQSKPTIIDIYYEDLYLIQRMLPVSPSDYIKFAKRPAKQTAIPEELHLTEDEKKQWKRDHSHLHVAISNKDTVELFRKYVKKLESGISKYTFDTFIAIVDHEKSDTICLTNFKDSYIYYDQTIMKPDTVFSQLVYDIIKYRDPDFVCAAF